MFLNYALHRLALLGYILSSAPSEPNRIDYLICVCHRPECHHAARACVLCQVLSLCCWQLSVFEGTHTHTKDLRSCGCHLEAMGTRAVLRLLLGEEHLPRMLVALASVTWTEKGKEKKVMTGGGGGRGLV